MTISFESEDENAHGGRIAAKIRIDDRYLNFRISFYPLVAKLYKEGNYRRIAEITVHEFAHILTEPLYRQAINAQTNMSGEMLEEIRERQTQRMTNVIITNLPKSIYTPKGYGKPKRVYKKSRKAKAKGKKPRRTA